MKNFGVLAALSVCVAMSAKAETYDASMCVSRDGPLQIVTPDHPVEPWDVCELELKVVSRGFNTPKLTLVRPAVYDPALNAFQLAGPMTQTEQLVVGEDLLVFDYTHAGLQLVYVISTRRMVFAKLRSPGEQMLTLGRFQALEKEHDRQLALVAVGDTPTYRSTAKTPSGSMPRGRVVVVEDIGRSETGEPMTKIRCVSKDQTCPRRAAWVDTGNIQLLTPSAIPAGPLPTVKVGPVGLKLKSCHFANTISSADEFETIIEADLKLPKLLELQLKKSWSRKRTKASEITYPADTEIRGTPFVVTGYAQGRISKNRGARPGWVPSEISAVLLQTVSVNCDTKKVRYQFEVVTPEGVFDAGPFAMSLQFANSLEQKAFVDALKTRAVPSLPDWLIGFMAAELSKK